MRTRRGEQHFRRTSTLMEKSDQLKGLIEKFLLTCEVGLPVR